MTPALALHLESLIDAAVSILGPPPAPRWLSDVTRSLRVTEGKRGPRPEAPEGDLLNPDQHPPQRAVLRMWASARWRVLVVLGPPQDGKDTGCIGPIFVHTIAERRRPIVYATTDLRLSGKMVRSKILPVFKASGLGHLLPTGGLASSGGTPDEILFNTGVRSYFLGAGASNGAGQAGVTAWAVIINEADKVRATQREKLLDRNKSYGDERQSLLIGTVDVDTEGGLYSIYGESTQGRMHHPCRRCGVYQALEPEQVEYDATNPDLARSTARIRCSACKETLDEDDRQWMVAHSIEVHAGQRIEGRGTTGPDAGRLVGEPLASEFGGLRWWALDSPFRSLREYAAEERAAKETMAKTGDDRVLREFTHTEQVRPYRNQDKTLALREMSLAVRAADAVHARGEAPADADICAIGIDQQLRRLLFSVIAYRASDHCWWIVDYGFQGICTEGESPTDAQAQRALSAIEARVMGGYARPSGLLLRPMAGGVDISDGGTQERALTWLRSRTGWYPIRGQSDYARAQHASDAAGDAIFRLPGVLAIYRQRKSLPHWDRFDPDVDSLKADIFRSLERQPGSPGAGHLPRGEGAQDDLIRQLTAERQEMTDSGPRWVAIRRHNHYLDTTVYGLAFCKYLAHLRTVRSGQVGAAAAVAAIAGAA
jgi:phage terminase large subunit GpA-like protein